MLKQHFFAEYIDKWDVSHSADCCDFLLIYGVSVESLVVILLICFQNQALWSGCYLHRFLVSVFATAQKKNPVLPRSLTLLSTSIPSVDCRCLSLPIWLLLAWYETRLLLYSQGSRAFLTLCDFQLPICCLKSVPDQQATKRLICFGFTVERFFAQPWRLNDACFRITLWLLDLIYATIAIGNGHVRSYLHSSRCPFCSGSILTFYYSYVSMKELHHMVYTWTLLKCLLN